MHQVVIALVIFDSTYLLAAMMPVGFLSASRRKYVPERIVNSYLFSLGPAEARTLWRCSKTSYHRLVIMGDITSRRVGLGGNAPGC